jgi:hypothetical protein
VLEWHKRRLLKDERKIREDLRLLEQAQPFWRVHTGRGWINR